MPVKIRDRDAADTVVGAIADALRPYAASHPASEVDVHRYSPISVRARVINPAFRGQSRSERHKAVWSFLHTLDEDILGELTMLLLLTPEERDSSVANHDFDSAAFAKDYAAALKASQVNGIMPP